MYNIKKKIVDLSTIASTGKQKWKSKLKFKANRE